MNLTNKVLENIEPGETVWDDKLSGFGARKQTLKGNVSFFLKSRIRGRQKFFTIGRYGQWTIQRARVEAKRLIGIISTGEDPEKEEKLTNIRIKDLVQKWLSDHAKTKLKNSSYIRYAGLVRDYINPKLGNIYIDKLDNKTLVRFHDTLSNKPRTANYCISTISSMWSWAEKRGFVTEINPCLGFEKYKEIKRKRYLTEDEVLRLGKAIELEKKINPYAIVAIQLLIMTGARLSEILESKWDWIKDDVLYLPDSKSGKKEITLPSPVLKILNKLPRQKNNPYIIVGKNTGKHLVNLRKVWIRVIKRAEIDHIRLHDLRHSFASFAIGKGAPLALIGGQLGHKSTSTTQRYAHLSRDPIRQVTETTAIAIEKAMQGHGK